MDVSHECMRCGIPEGVLALRGDGGSGSESRSEAFGDGLG